MLILASASQTRKQLLENAGFSVRAQPARIDERTVERRFADAGSPDPEALAGHLAIAKARAVGADHPAALVIGADQTLAHDDEQLHKPRDMAEAAAQLRRLRGATHTLHAGVALVRNDECVFTYVETARLTMRDFSDVELDKVLELEGHAVLDSVGAYRLEGPSVRLFARIEGDYFTILGLPLLPLLAALRDHAPDT